MAKTAGVSPATVQRIWHDHRIYPHKVRTFKVSNDTDFLAKLTDVVGLYLNPPDRAVLLCLDEKSMIQALDRTQPGLPIKPGKAGTMTHDYKRHGTTNLYAALNLLDGVVVGQCTARHRHQEFLSFLRRLDREFPKSKDLHIVLDNASSHLHANVGAWLDAHPRFRLHFVPARIPPPWTPSAPIALSPPPAVHRDDAGALAWMVYTLPALGSLGALVFIVVQPRPIYIAGGLLFAFSAVALGVLMGTATALAATQH